MYLCAEGLQRALHTRKRHQWEATVILCLLFGRSRVSPFEVVHHTQSLYSRRHLNDELTQKMQTELQTSTEHTVEAVTRQVKVSTITCVNTASSPEQAKKKLMANLFRICLAADKCFHSFKCATVNHFIGLFIIKLCQKYKELLVGLS